MTENIEVRCISDECRSSETDGKRFIEGYAALYNHRSKLIFERGDLFFEEIQRGAFDAVLSKENLNVIATPNHTYSQVLGRTTNKTLELTTDEKGLRYKVEIPNTSFGNDIYESIKRGDTYESSFTFQIDQKGQNWTKDETGNNLRFITKFSNLIEVGPVTSGAYSDTKVAARNLAEMSETEKPKESNLELFKRKLQILKLRK